VPERMRRHRLGQMRGATRLLTDAPDRSLRHRVPGFAPGKSQSLGR
jgi:hypothetical protein